MITIDPVVIRTQYLWVSSHKFDRMSRRGGAANVSIYPANTILNAGHNHRRRPNNVACLLDSCEIHHQWVLLHAGICKLYASERERERVVW